MKGRSTFTRESCWKTALLPAESLWVRIRGQTAVGTVVDVCYRSPDTEAEDLLGQLEKASFQAQVLMGYLLEGQHGKAEAILEFSGVH